MLFLIDTIGLENPPLCPYVRYVYNRLFLGWWIDQYASYANQKQLSMFHLFMKMTFCREVVKRRLNAPFKREQTQLEKLKRALKPEELNTVMINFTDR